MLALASPRVCIVLHFAQIGQAGVFCLLLTMALETKLKLVCLQVSQDMGTEAPVPISAKLGDFNNIFRRIVSSAERPHLSIPETEVGRSRKQYHRLVNRSLMFASGSSPEPLF